MDVDVVPARDCALCGVRLQIRAYLPAAGDLPAVAGYWCDDCQKDETVELDQSDDS